MPLPLFRSAVAERKLMMRAMHSLSRKSPCFEVTNNLTYSGLWIEYVRSGKPQRIPHHERHEIREGLRYPAAMLEPIDGYGYEEYYDADDEVWPRKRVVEV